MTPKWEPDRPARLARRSAGRGLGIHLGNPDLFKEINLGKGFLDYRLVEGEGIAVARQNHLGPQPGDLPQGLPVVVETMVTCNL